MTFSPLDKKIIAPFVTDAEDDIYCLRNLPPEVVAVLFAYVSRSPKSFRENLLELIRQKDFDLAQSGQAYGEETEEGQSEEFAIAQEKARKFHEKWVIGYGHASVAEHADIKFALENVSIIASKVIEDCRLASFTEKSTRYQIFTPPKYYKGQEIIASMCGAAYIETADFLFGEYNALQQEAAEWLSKQTPKEEGVPEKAHRNSINAAACDIARYLLPAATLTSIGASINAREAAWAITKFLSHPLAEMNAIGRRMLNEGAKITPTLLKYATKSDYIENVYSTGELLATNIQFSASFEGWKPPKKRRDVEIVSFDSEGENKILAAFLYGHLHVPFEKVMARVKGWDDDLKAAILRQAIGDIGPYDIPPREFEMASITTDILIDYGAFRDIQRHRIATQIVQTETVKHGFSAPEEIAAMGWEERFNEAMMRAAETFAQMEKEIPEYARYIVPLAFKKRSLITWNLRELFHFIRLRSAPAGHISYRKLAWSLYEQLSEIYPLIMKHYVCDRSQIPLGRLKGEIKQEKKTRKE